MIDGLNNTTAEGWSFAASYIRVQGFEVKGFSDDAFSNYSGGRYLDIIGNHIHDIGRYAPGENGCTNSLYYQTNDHAVYVASANNVIIRNNIFYRNQHGWSVHIYPNPVNNLSILNNIFAVPNTWEPGYIILAAAVTNSGSTTTSSISRMLLASIFTTPGKLAEVTWSRFFGKRYPKISHGEPECDPSEVACIEERCRLRVL